MDIRDRITGFVRELPVAHRVAIGAALAALVMLGVLFVRWITTPSYTVLYSGLDDAAVAAVIDGLETQGVPYRLEAGGSRVLIPREQLYTTRALLAADGVAGPTRVPGYELLDDQGLSVSDFRQRVDYQRALEGELSRTLTAMDGIASATVHLVLPEEELFAERQQPVTASVLLGTARTLTETEVEAVTFLVASSVEGLEVGDITVADASGTVLHAPGDAGGSSVATNRNLRQTREFEQALAADIGALLERVTGGIPASVVVRSALDFDELATETESYDGDNQVTLKEQSSTERFEGSGAVPGGAVGIDGGPLPADVDESVYERDEALREFGVNRVTTRTVSAPGRVERLSVAIVMDDGSLTGAQIPADAEIETLVAAAVGLDAERGDVIAVSTLPFPAPEEEPEPEQPNALTEMIPQLVGILVLLLVSIALFLMTRRRGVIVEEIDRRRTHALPAREDTRIVDAPEPEPAEEAASSLQADVAELVQRQPEEIATLLRGWLADRRGL